MANLQVWDLTAGKLLHDFNFHDGHITSLDFHPLEFLLATGDLVTFEYDIEFKSLSRVRTYVLKDFPNPVRQE